jgi:hypothetical protein
MLKCIFREQSVCARNINISGSCACGKKLAVPMEAGAFLDRQRSVFTEGIWCTDLALLQTVPVFTHIAIKATDYRSLEATSKHLIRFTQFPHGLLCPHQPLNGT